MKIIKKIEDEIEGFTNGQIELSDGIYFNQYNIVKRISRFLSKSYSSGNIDSQDNYKYWYDIISPRIDSEVKNIDFDTKDIILMSDSKKDGAALFLANMRLKEWMREKEEGVKLNDGIEHGSMWGNTVWKKIKGGYEMLDPLNLYVINQTARTLDDTPVIERHVLTQTELRQKKGIWDDEAIDAAIKDCGLDGYSVTKDGNKELNKEALYYEVYERNGEVSLADLKEAQGKDYDPKDDDKFVLAKIVCIGMGQGSNKKEEDKYILFADTIKAGTYKEYHRGRYQGRWWREGLVEVLFDIQTRANAIGNQIARALEFGSHQIFRSSDPLIYKNILTDLKRGDIIQTQDLQRVDMKMGDMNNYINEWNLLMEQADKLSNSFEVVQGQNMASGTPFRLGAMLNVNANKLYDFIREKLALTIKSIVSDWVLPDLLKDLKAKDVMRLTGDPEYLQKYKELVANGWYARNLASLGPHSPEEAQSLKDAILESIDTSEPIEYENKVFDEFKPRVDVIITGESMNIAGDLETLSNFIRLEGDPIRRTALIEKAMMKKGIDVSTLPKSPPQQAPQPEQAQSRQTQGPTSPGVQTQSPNQQM